MSFKNLRKIIEEDHPPLRLLRGLNIPIERDFLEHVVDSEVIVSFRVDDGRQWQAANAYDEYWNGIEKVVKLAYLTDLLTVQFCKHQK